MKTNVSINEDRDCIFFTTALTEDQLDLIKNKDFHIESWITCTNSYVDSEGKMATDPKPAYELHTMIKHK